mmetsp:Transcript_20930/g.18563  ORF Transcript_20930/g.18563 Transcript_20930/m.18563 type:complete len:209 (+) Transcript_20930:2-628(+)
MDMFSIIFSLCYYLVILLLIYYAFIITIYFIGMKLFPETADNIMKLQNKVVMVILGSGGHTTEMITLLKNHHFEKYYNTTVIIAEGDIFSKHKFEKSYRKNHGIELSDYEKMGKLTYQVINRSRKVGQSFPSAVLTTLIASFECVQIFLSSRPDIIISNGPGTALPLFYIGFLFGKILLLKPKVKLLYIESIARLSSLSLTGKLVYYI